MEYLTFIWHGGEHEHQYQHSWFVHVVQYFVQYLYYTNELDVQYAHYDE